MTNIQDTCPVCKGEIPENRLLRTPDPDPHIPPAVLSFMFCSGCEYLFLKPRSNTYSEIYRFEAELPSPLTEPALDLLAQIQEKVMEPEGRWEYDVNFLSDLQSGEMTEEEVLDVLVDGLTLRLEIKEFHVSWQCSSEELEALGVTKEAPMSQLIEQVLDDFYENHAHYIYSDTADAVVQELKGVSVSGENLSFACTGWEAGD